MFIYQLVVKVEFGHFLSETFPGIFLFLWQHLHANRGIDRVGLDVEFWFEMTQVHPFSPREMGFFAAMKHEVCSWPLPGDDFSIPTRRCVSDAWFHQLPPFWGISEVPDLLTGDSECLAGDGESCTLMLGWSWYVDWFSLSIREQWFSNFSDKNCLWMLNVASALGLGPCSIEAPWKFCDRQECSAIDCTGTWGTRRRAHCCSMESVWW